MQTISKRLMALMLAVIMALPAVFAVQFFANAEVVGNQPLQTATSFTVNFKTSDGASIIETRTVIAGEPLGTLPENSTPLHIGETNTHTAYRWEGVNAQTVVEADTDYTESASEANCNFSIIAQTDATQELNGYYTYICNCGNSYIEYYAQDWRNYDNAMAAYEEICSSSDYTTKYTLAARTAYESTVFSARLDPSDESLSPTKIENAVLAISRAQALLDESADFSELINAYNSANEFLLSLDGKAAQYSAASVRALVDALSDAKVAEYLNAADPSAYGKEDENAANALAEGIDAAFTSLEKTSGGTTDVTAYSEAAQVANYIDLDAYNNTSSISSAIRIANILIKTTKIEYTDVTNDENIATVHTFSSKETQQNVNDATRTILDALYVSVKTYTITSSGDVADVSFQNGTSTGDTTPYTATYGATLIAHSDSKDTAWYLDFSSDSTSRARQYQGFGETFSAKVIGNMNVYAETRSSAKPNMIKIYRNYSNDPQNVSLIAVDFTNGGYVLPAASAYSGYSFAGYEVDGVMKNAGDAIEVSGDMNISAVYNFTGSADEFAINAAALDGGEGINASFAYNEKVSLKGGAGAYAWVEILDNGDVRPFYIGSDVTFLVSEATNLAAVTEEQFNAYNFTLPAINMRNAGVITNGTKVSFNGQIVDANSKVREYGVLVAVAKNGAALNADELTVENVGSHTDCDIIRAKSTKNVGANQFAIGINSLAGKDFIYRGYLIYEKENGEFVTVYN